MVKQPKMDLSIRPFQMLVNWSKILALNVHFYLPSEKKGFHKELKFCKSTSPVELQIVHKLMFCSFDYLDDDTLPIKNMKF